MGAINPTSITPTTNTAETPTDASAAPSAAGLATLTGAASAPTSGDPLEQMVAEGAAAIKEPQLSKDSTPPAQTDDANKTTSSKDDSSKTKSPYLRKLPFSS